MNNKYWKTVQDNVDDVTSDPFNQAFSNIADDIEVLQQKPSSDFSSKLLEYYGTTDIEITPESDFTVEDDMIMEYNGTAETVVIPYKVNGNLITDIDNYAFGARSSLTSVTIPSSVTHIGNSAFHACSNLTNINIPNSVTSIGNSMFEDCSSLTNITIPNSVTYISNSAFRRCNSLTNINIPNSVTSIGNSMFEDCSSLTNITIPNSVTSIGDSAFNTCRNLANINIPNSVTSIGKDVFRYCRNLINVTIGNGVTSIGDYAFCACDNLTSITIPNNVTNIGKYTFYGCENLTSVTIGNGVTSIDSTVFGLIPENAVFYVEQGSYGETWCKENGKNYKYTNIEKNYYATNDNVVTKSSEVKDTVITIGESEGSYGGSAIKFDGVELWVGNAQHAMTALYDESGNRIHTTYAEKTKLNYLGTGMEIPLSQYDNTIMVTAGNTSETIFLHFDLDGSFSPTYNCQINFTSGETPTEITYASTGIINWVGTDCKLQDGKSIFTPSANTRYNIVIYFDGNTFVGCVNGFTPATINNNGTEVS